MINNRRIWSFLTAFGVLTLCGASLWRTGSHTDGWSILTIRGALKTFNISRNWILLGTFGTVEKPGKVICRDGDLLWITPKDGFDMFLRHRASGGGDVEFRFDDNKDGLVRRNGKPVAAYLGDDSSAAWTTIASGPMRILAGLECLYLSKSVPEDRLPVLKRAGKANPRMGIVISPKDGLHRIAGYFTPSWCFLGESSGESPGFIPAAWLGSLELVGMGLDGVKDISFLAKMPRLKELQLTKYDPSIHGPMPPVSGLKKLLIADSELTDLGSLRNLTGLEELVLAGCDTLEDLGGLTGMTGLRTLCLSGQNAVKDYTPCSALKHLEYLSLPSGLDLEAFRRLVTDHPNLGYLELSAVSNAEMISQVCRLKGLKGLVLLSLSSRPEVLSAMSGLKSITGLRLLVLPEDFYKTESGVRFSAELGQSLQGCDIVAGSAMCMGSGWLLLLPAAVLLAASAGWTRRRKDNAGRKE
jgi:hypothetical protein